MNWPDSNDCPQLSDHQKAELTKALRGSLCILGGRPGTGKTFCLAAIMQLLRGRRVGLAAPTGKAAVRLTESLAQRGVLERATTIHRLLHVVPEDGAWKFEFNETNKLPLDFIFIDEASMIDTPLMASLLAARPSGCGVLLVGDPGQLSPVGHGAPLRDLIAAGLPFGHLTEIQRNSGRIVQVCKEIAEGKGFHPAMSLDLAAGDNLVHIERERPEDQIDVLRDFLKRVRQKGERDVVEDVQIVVPVNEKSPLARKTLNKELQGYLNPDGQRVEGNPFRVGDKIVNGRNGFLPDKGSLDAEVNQDGKVYVANGELARVEEVGALWTIARLQNPERRVLIPRGGGNAGEEGDEENGQEKQQTGCHWELGYAISVHKSQGSEWPVVVVMIDSYPGAVRLCTKEWLYTAISRGKEITLTIGQRRIAQAMCRRSGIWARKTFLRERIEALRLESAGRAIDGVLA